MDALSWEDLAPCAFDLNDGGEEATPLTMENVASAVLAGCQTRLVGRRRRGLEALREGFIKHEDLQLQLAALPTGVLLTMLKGRVTLSVNELLECFVLPSSSEAEAVAAGFKLVSSSFPRFFLDVLHDGAGFGEANRLQLLTWCTALTALPVGGLRENKIRLRLYGPDVDDATLPETHTCTRELHLPNYSNATTLRSKLLLALSHASDGFLKE